MTWRLSTGIRRRLAVGRDDPDDDGATMTGTRPHPRLTVVPVGGFQAYLWHDAQSAVLVDTGPVGGFDALSAGIEEASVALGDLDLIVLTHFHDDHVGGAAELLTHTGARVVAHAADAPVIRGDQEGPPPNFTAAERALHATVAADLRPAPPCRVDVEVVDGDELPFGGGARVIGTPGHTDGSIAVHLPGERVLFTGDILAEHQGRVIPGVFNLDTAVVHDSVRRLAALDVDVACFGHGRPLTDDAGTVLRDLAASL
jgi:glyoxylase-like metal-dependent hydrolase (beta-lactamase superfamily II)